MTVMIRSCDTRVFTWLEKEEPVSFACKDSLESMKFSISVGRWEEVYSRREALVLKAFRLLLLSLDSLTSLAFNFTQRCTDQAMNELCSIINSSPLNQLISLKLSNYDYAYFLNRQYDRKNDPFYPKYVDVSLLENILRCVDDLYIHHVRMTPHSIKLLLKDENFKFKSLMLNSILVGNQNKGKMKQNINESLESILDAYIKANPHAIIQRSLDEWEQSPVLTLINNI